MVPKLEKLVCILGANKNYEACQNGCASLIATRLNHHILVAELRKSIAHGISSFPALPNYKSHPLCDCADQAPHELMLDICQVLKTGYRRTFQPQLQAFAIVTEALEDGRHGDMPGILDLSLTCREEAYTLFEAKSIHRMLLIDVLIQGLLSTETLYKGIVSNSIASFVEYETTPTFRFHSQILEPPGSMPEHRLIAYTICFLVLLDGERPPAPAPDISVLREYRRHKKLMADLYGILYRPDSIRGAPKV
jgi:hypothetical protein